MWNNRMLSGELTLGVIFLSQTTVGVLGNFSFLYHHLFLRCSGGTQRSLHLILRHVVIANTLVLLCKGVPQTMAVWGLKHFSSDWGCKLLLYVQRVGRDVSIFTICLLSIFQAITVNPTNSCWKNLGVQAPRSVGASILLCWVLCLLANALFPFYASHLSDRWDSENITSKKAFGACSTKGHHRMMSTFYTVLIVLPELWLSLLMVWASGSMVRVLHRHRQRVRHLHRTGVHSRLSPETRATKSILVLAGTFVAFYTISSMFHVCVAHFPNPSWWLVNTSAFFSLCFPTISPFLLMSCDCRVSGFCCVWICFSRSPSLPRSV